MRIGPHCRSFLTAATLAFALAAAPAEASTIWVRDGNGGNVFNGGPGAVNITVQVNGTNKSVAAGAFALQYKFSDLQPPKAQNDPGWTDFLTYCLEPDETLGLSGLTPKQGAFDEGIGSSIYAPDAMALTQLVNTHFADSLTSATKSAAFQVALWEIAFDASSDLAAGQFKFTKPGAVLNQAKAYLNPASWVSGGDNLDVILRIGNQDLIVQVPEPATLALFGAGLIGLGFASRRRVACPA